MNLDIDLVAHHVPGKRNAVVIYAGAALVDDDDAIGDTRLSDVELHPRRTGSSHQSTPIGITAVPAALDEIVLDDVFRGDLRFAVVCSAGDGEASTTRHSF